MITTPQSRRHPAFSMSSRTPEGAVRLYHRNVLLIKLQNTAIRIHEFNIVATANLERM